MRKYYQSTSKACTKLQKHLIVQVSLQGAMPSSSVKTPQRPSRKITPALPRRTPLVPAMPIPRALQATAQGESDPVQLKLQQAFLDQYSAPHHTVCLTPPSSLPWSGSNISQQSRSYQHKHALQINCHQGIIKGPGVRAQVL